MCGIAFIINYNNRNLLDLNFVKNMFQKLEERGTDSSGIYWEREDKNKGTLRRLVKAPCTATELWNKLQEKIEPCDKNGIPYLWSEEGTFYNKFHLNGKERLIFLHCRAKTKGSELDNNNNMPIVSNNYVLIHNGVIGNDSITKYDYKGEVDSEEILARFETKKSLKKAMDELHGSLAIVFKEFDAKHIHIYRHASPLSLIYFTKHKLLVGISNTDYVDIPHEETQLENFFDRKVTVDNVPEYNMYKINLFEPKIEFEFKIDNRWKKTWKASNKTWEWTRED